MNTTFKDPKAKQWLISVLQHEANVQIKFLKTDGTEREMNCTLKEDIVEPYEKKTDKVKARNEDVLPVFDLDKKAWRSFRLDSILSVNFTIS